MHTLLAADCPSARTTLSDMLESMRNRLSVAEHTDDLKAFCTLYEIDVIVLSENFCSLTAFEIIRKLRQAGLPTPIIVILHDRNPVMCCQLLSVGADDCISGDFGAEELDARVRAVARRSAGHTSSVIKVGRTEIRLDNKEIVVDGKQIPLTTKEYLIVESLGLRKNMTLSKEQLLSRIYGGMDEPQDKIIDVFVCKVRKKIREVTGDYGLIDTVWGRGYVIREHTEI